MLMYVINTCMLRYLDVDGFHVTDCDCPDACEVKSYGVDLSYAALSTLSVDSLLDEDVDNLTWKYHRALEIQQVRRYGYTGNTIYITIIA